MDQRDYKELALLLLAANSAAEVKAIVEAPSHKQFFGAAANWRNYGDEDKNWDRAGSQQNNAIGALTELITNAQDAVLTRKAMRPDDVAPTITTKCVSITNGRFGHYDTTQHRGLTPREAALLQTFPIDYVFYPEDNLQFAATLIGNAVPPRLGKFFGNYVSDCVSGKLRS